MPKLEIEEFAKLLVREVRDKAVKDSDISLHSPGPTGRRWRRATEGGSIDQFVEAIIPDVVDETIFQLLRAIDEGSLQLMFRDTSGKLVDLVSEGHGELAGWYVGVGWRENYSTERFASADSDADR